MSRFTILLPLFLLLLHIDLSAQSFGVENLRIGMPVDSVLGLLRGRYTAIDTTRSTYTSTTSSIRLAPVPLAGLDGVLVLRTAAGGKIAEFAWSRQEATGYQRIGVWEEFHGWDDWRAPTWEETEKVAKSMSGTLGRIMNSGPAPMSDDGSATMRGFWRIEGMVMNMRHDGRMLSIHATPWSSDMVEMTE